MLKSITEKTTEGMPSRGECRKVARPIRLATVETNEMVMKQASRTEVLRKVFPSVLE